MNAKSPFDTYDGLKDAYLRYYETTYWLRDPELRQERRALLERPGKLFTDPLVEPVLPYPSTDDLLDVTRSAGIDDRIADAVGRALFGSFVDAESPISLRAHQAEAIRHSFKPGIDPGRNVVVTSGTGSGKTESFLLPLLLRIATEADRWSPQPAANEWWTQKQGSSWMPLRAQERRPASNQRRMNGGHRSKAAVGCRSERRSAAPQLCGPSFCIRQMLWSKTRLYD